MSGTWQDSYPYNANSTFALHPQYLRLSEVGYLNDEVEQVRFDALREELNRLPDVDYERVNRAKMEYLRLLFEEQGEATLSSDGFKAFFRDNSFWLRPYAAFCSLRDRFGTANFSCWEEHSFYDESALPTIVPCGVRGIIGRIVLLYSVSFACSIIRSQGVCPSGRSGFERRYSHRNQSYQCRCVGQSATLSHG